MRNLYKVGERVKIIFQPNSYIQQRIGIVSNMLKLNGHIGVITGIGKFRDENIYRVDSDGEEWTYLESMLMNIDRRTITNE